MKIAFVVKNRKSAGIYQKIREYTDYLKSKGIRVIIENSMSDTIKPGFPHFSDKVPGDVDVVVVFGGDGTFLWAIRLIGRQSIPVIGVNIGGLGFLTEITMDELYAVTDLVIAGKAVYEKRMRLCTEVYNGSTLTIAYDVLNDAVISKSAMARMISIKTNVDRNYMTTCKADGLIISTSTGSTAYSMAAGGPIVYPTTDTIILTPISPHTLSNRPIVLSSGAVVEIELETEEKNVVVTLDGQVSRPIDKGNRIVISKSSYYTTVIKSPFKNYFEILRQKLKWGEG